MEIKSTENGSHSDETLSSDISFEIIPTKKDIDIDEELKKRINKALEIHIKKYFPKAIVDVIISKETHKMRIEFHVEVRVHEGIRNTEFVKVESNGDSIDIAVNNAAITLKHKLGRYKGKLQSQKRSIPSHASTSYIYNSHAFTEQPKIVAIKEVPIDIKKLTLEDAVMQLDLTSLKAFLFVNFETNRLNMLYEKGDGNLVLVDTPPELNASPNELDTAPKELNAPAD